MMLHHFELKYESYLEDEWNKRETRSKYANWNSFVYSMWWRREEERMENEA